MHRELSRMTHYLSSSQATSRDDPLSLNIFFFAPLEKHSKSETEEININNGMNVRKFIVLIEVVI